MFSKWFCPDRNRPAQEETSQRVITVPAEVMKDPEFKKELLNYQYLASRRYLIVAVLCELACAVISFQQPCSWKAKIGPIEIIDAAPGVLLSILGLALVWWTEFRVNATRPPQTPPSPPTPPTPPTPPPNPSGGWAICRWLRLLFRRRAAERSRHLSWGTRGIEVPEDCTDPVFWKLAAKYESRYANDGLIAAVTVMIFGVVGASIGIFVQRHWKVEFLWLQIVDAPPAIVLIIVGFAIAVMTQFDVKVAGNNTKQPGGNPEQGGNAGHQDTKTGHGGGNSGDTGHGAH